MTSDSSVEALLDLLERERACLKEGRLDRLAALAGEKERLMRAVAGSRAGQADLARIAGLTRRNAALLEAAGAGVKAARRRLKALRDAPGPIRSYGAEGQERAIGAVLPSLSRKA